MSWVRLPLAAPLFNEQTIKNSTSHRQPFVSDYRKAYNNKINFQSDFREVYLMMKAVKFVLGFLFTVSLSANFSFGQQKTEVYAKGELLVKFKSGTASRTALTVNSRLNSVVLEEFPDLGWQRVKIADGFSVETATARYAAFEDVETVQPNYYYHLLATPNDTRFPENGMYGLRSISAPLAWDLTTGSPNVVVADIDTGLRYTHEDLAANSWANPGEVAGNGLDDDGNGFIDDVRGWDFFYNDSNPIDDAGGHGTHTAGTIGAVGNNARGVVGVNWNVKIMAVKIYSPNGGDSTSAMLVNAYNYIRMMKNRGVNIRVTNNSYGGCGEACGYDQATKDALDAMGNAGILNVFAAGNDNRNIETFPAYPASYTSPSVLAVASSTSTDARSGFSNFGATSVDLAAPGSGVLSTYNGSDASYASLSGTSMATPHVAGAAALLSAYNPNLSPASLKATLMNSVDVLSQWNGLVKTGGRLNVSRALLNQTVCNFNLSQTALTAANSGGSYSLNVAAPTNCDFSATSNVSWMTVTGGNPGSGSGAVNFTVQTNNLPDMQRSGIITIGNQTFTVTQGTPFLARQTVLDFDGDRRTDFSAIQNNNGAMVWHNQRSTAGYSPVSFGSFSDDIPVPNDFDGDGKTDVAVWRNSTGTFYVFRSGTNTVQGFQFGQTGDNPNISQDFDGDGKADFAVSRAQSGNLFWYIYGSTSGFRGVNFGTATDKPLRGDFDGDGKADLAVYRPSNSTWYTSPNPAINYGAIQFGVSTDKLVPADYDGDGKTDIAVFRPSNGIWYYLQSSNGSFRAAAFGTTGDLPTPGDYDGDGKSDFAVWRPNTNPNDAGIFYVQSSSNGFSAFGWGNSQMKIPANTILGQ
ncbi:MAG: S8 family serine peptidase [Pyrinomonadaceae bacterium]|nr:S8 family serine peptidase [Pyrinomonadaceae bacterium]